MSQASVKTVTRAQKDQGECEKCHVPLPKGEPYRWFKVGFRSKFKHKRCMKPECTPTTSEKESSKMADVYAAQEAAESDIDVAGSAEDIKSALEALCDAVNQTAEEYREAATNDAGVTFNVEAEEKADALESYAGELESWEPENDPDDEDAKEECGHCDGSGECSIGGDEFENDEQCAECEALHQDPVCGQCNGEGSFELRDEDRERILEEAKESAKEVVGALEF